MPKLCVLDRDGTIITDRHFLANPDGVELLPGAAAAIRRLNEAGWIVAICTNQSGVGRGYYTLRQMHATNARVVEVLAKEGARIDDVEYCPHHPLAGDPVLRRVCACRKPGVGQVVAAARKTGGSLTGVVVVGDRLQDVYAGLNLGGFGVLVRTGYGEQHRMLAEHRLRKPSAIVPALPDAVDWILKNL